MATNYEVAHAWAHNINKCTHAQSMHHSHGLIYSYSTCIGQRLEIGDNIVFVLDTGSFSNTTCKHQIEVSSAIPDKNPNVYVFRVNMQGWGSDYIVHDVIYNDEALRKDLINFCFYLMLEDYDHCISITKCKTLNHGITDLGYQQMVKWLEVTKCVSLNKFLNCSIAKLDNTLPYRILDRIDHKTHSCKKFMRFVRGIHNGCPISKIVDSVHGKGTWDAYQQRISGLIKAQKNRKLSDYIGYEHKNNKIFGMWPATVKGSITDKTRQKHQKKGDWIRFLVETKHKNFLKAFEAQEMLEANNRKFKAKRKLEEHCGMSGWDKYYSFYPFHFSFDYNGTVIEIDNNNAHYYRPRHIGTDEYQEYIKLSPKDKKQWISDKKDWMLQQLQANKREHDEWQQRVDKADEIRKKDIEFQQKFYSEKSEYIHDMKAKGPEGIKQLWHEGLNISANGLPITAFNGGNAWLRLKNDMVETSKGIRVTIAECKRLWKFISRWHENKSTFNSGEIVQATMSDFTISRFQDDIMIAGCHAIAFVEMENIAKQLNLIA